MDNLNAFQQWASGLLDYEYIQQAIDEREEVLTRVYSKEYMLERWKKIGYTPPKIENKQLELF